MTKYRTIVVDPPWSYPEGHIRTEATGCSKNVKRDGAQATVGKDVRRSLPYPSMTVPEIEALPVRDLASRNCRLFLWATNRYLPDAFDVLVEWRFRYVQTLIWHKADGGPFAAHIAPNTAEFLVVAVAGSPPRTGTLPSSVIRDGAPKEHSRKPDCFQDHIEAVSPGPYLELFARRQRLGWDTWGDEALNHISLDTGHRKAVTT